MEKRSIERVRQKEKEIEKRKRKNKYIVIKSKILLKTPERETELCIVKPVSAILYRLYRMKGRKINQEQKSGDKSGIF